MTQFTSTWPVSFNVRRRATVALSRATRIVTHRNKLDVLRILRVKAPRLQEKYLAEVQDIAGLCQRAVTSLTVDALEVSSFDGLSMNEFLMVPRRTFRSRRVAPAHAGS